jgi:L-alanine-DL-glutamate epimerase-like enolase superfamily enzyme
MAFAPMSHRVMAVVEVELEDGSVGVGETWVNYPSWARLERVATVRDGVAPLLRGRRFEHPGGAQQWMLGQLTPIGRQWGAPGPIHQAVSGVDAALWHLAAQHADTTLAGLLAELSGGAVLSEVAVYASSLGPDDVAATAERCRALGITAAKVKLGFGSEKDIANLATARRVLGDDARLFGDANQAWSLAEALAMVPVLRDHGVEWLEEPLAGDRVDELRTLAEAGGIPLATGENLYGAAAFAPYLDSGAVQIVQPDVSKVGGITEYLGVLDRAAGTGTIVNPHLYNGAVATAATIQLAAVSRATRLLEWDIRSNPLRAPVDDLLTDHGTVTLPTGDVDLDRLADLEEKL